MKTCLPATKPAYKPGNDFTFYLMKRFGVSQNEIRDIVSRTGISERRIAEFLWKRDKKNVRNFTRSNHLFSDFTTVEMKYGSDGNIIAAEFPARF